MILNDKTMAQLADEYVLGLLENADAAALETELQTNAALRDAVAASRDQFLALDTSIEPADLDPQLWNRIDARLETASLSAQSAETSTAEGPSASDTPSDAGRAVYADPSAPFTTGDTLPIDTAPSVGVNRIDRSTPGNSDGLAKDENAEGLANHANAAGPARPGTPVNTENPASSGNGPGSANTLPDGANDNRRSGWRLTALTSLAATLLLAIGLTWALLSRPEPVVIAVLLNASGEPQAVVEDFGNEQATIRLLADFPVPEGKTLQVWTLPSQDMGPISLGLLDDRQSATLHGPTLPQPRNEQLYEITLEQSGGSPTGRPTGPILVKGYGRIPL
jgi:anti-sigma-K factor RskA